MTGTATRWPALIDGERVDTPETIEVLDPSTGEVFAAVARGTAEHVDAAVNSSRVAFEQRWRHIPAAERALACRRMADVIRAHAAELAALETADVGKPLRQSRIDVDVAARYFEYYGSTVEALFGETLPLGGEQLAYTLVEPHGVCGHIIPWNYPLQVAARTLSPALAAGNCCVLKPAEDAPLTSLRLGELALEAGFPPGVLNVVPGLGEEAGAALAAHPDLDHVAFTGSREVGQLVMMSAARSIVPVTLELGGKSPHIVLGDYDADLAVPLIVQSITENCGQNCSAGSRLLVQRGVHGELVEMVRHAFESLRIGRGGDDPDVGPLISARQRERVLDYIAEGRAVARLVTGGGAPGSAQLDGGFFVEPTLFDDVAPDARVAREEIFGPVLCVIPFDDLDEAIALANATEFGLAGGVWTRDVGVAHRLARELRCGQVFVNNYSAAGGVELPFGGYGRSGFGREKGFAALREYTRIKAVAVHVPQRP